LVATDNGKWRATMRAITALSFIVSLTGFVPNALAQLNRSLPAELESVGVEEHLDSQLPLDLPFVDSSKRKVTLGDCFKSGRPVVLTMNYSNCPMLCSLQLNGLFDGMKRMEWVLGKEFDMVTVSIDPEESSERAQLTKQKYMKGYGTGTPSAYHCLTGEDANIKELAAAVGFKYRYEKKTKQYIHAAVTMVCTPEGRISRYLYGVDYNPQTVKFALLEASEGKIGTTVDKMLMFCFHYDAESGKYGPSGFRMMQLGGLLTLFVFGGVLIKFWRREKVPDGQPDTTQEKQSDTTDNQNQQ
jgi:protein SCO1